MPEVSKRFLEYSFIAVFCVRMAVFTGKQNLAFMPWIKKNGVIGEDLFNQTFTTESAWWGTNIFNIVFPQFCEGISSRFSFGSTIFSWRETAKTPIIGSIKLHSLFFINHVSLKSRNPHTMKNLLWIIQTHISAFTLMKSAHNGNILLPPHKKKIRTFNCGERLFDAKSSVRSSTNQWLVQLLFIWSRLALFPAFRSRLSFFVMIVFNCNSNKNPQLINQRPRSIRWSIIKCHVLCLRNFSSCII